MMQFHGLTSVAKNSENHVCYAGNTPLFALKGLLLREFNRAAQERHAN